MRIAGTPLAVAVHPVSGAPLLLAEAGEDVICARTGDKLGQLCDMAPDGG